MSLSGTLDTALHATAIRHAWLRATAERLQATAVVSMARDLTDARDQLREIATAIPSPEGGLERLLLRGLLLECALRVGRALHAGLQTDAPDPCDLHASQLLARFCVEAHDDPITAFRVWVEGFFDLLLRQHPPSVAQRARRVIRETPRQPTSVADLARAVGVTPQRLRRAFLEEFGDSVKTYQVQVRLLSVLRSGDLAKVDALAFDAGYRSRKDLYRACQHTLGLSLTQFRELGPAQRATILVAADRRLGHATAASDLPHTRAGKRGEAARPKPARTRAAHGR